MQGTLPSDNVSDGRQEVTMNFTDQKDGKSMGAWQVRDLVILGVFAAAAKLSTLLVALVGGGMNPVTLLAKNCIFTVLMLVLLCKVRRPGTLTLFVCVNMLISLLLLGGAVSLLVPMLVAAVFAECMVFVCGGVHKTWPLFVGVGLYDLLSKVLSLGMSWFFMRENAAMMYVAVPMVALGYLGSIAGLFCGGQAVKELRHAGFIVE